MYRKKDSRWIRIVLNLSSFFKSVPFRYDEDGRMIKIAKWSKQYRLFLLILILSWTHSIFQLYQLTKFWNYYRQIGSVTHLVLHLLFSTAYLGCAVIYLHVLLNLNTIPKLVNEIYDVRDVLEGKGIQLLELGQSCRMGSRAIHHFPT
jgi:hypothetical protein